MDHVPSAWGAEPQPAPSQERTQSNALQRVAARLLTHIGEGDHEKQGDEGVEISEETALHFVEVAGKYGVHVSDVHVRELIFEVLTARSVRVLSMLSQAEREALHAIIVAGKKMGVLVVPADERGGRLIYIDYATGVRILGAREKMIAKMVQEK